jgi:hypothetical protein
MPITVKHTKVSDIPDADDDSLIRPSDWNDDHALTGLGTAAELDAGVPNGVATLDAGGKVPVSELPAAVLGALSYQGTWDASTNTPTLTSSVGTKGYYYVVNVAGNTNLNGITDWQIGDWAVYNGTVWQKVDNTDAGGDVVGPASATDNAITRFDGTTGKVIQNSVVTMDDTGNIANATLTSPKINQILDASGNEVLGLLSTASATDYVGIKNGIGVGVPLHISSEGSSTNIGLHIQPKGTGLVTISDGTDFNKGIRFRSSGSAASAITLLDAVSTAGHVVTLPDATTTLVGRNTTDTLTNKSISGSTNTLSNIGNASLTNSAITINGTSTSLGGSINVGTVTSVSGTAGRISSTGGTTPVIDLVSGIATAGTTGSSSLIPVVTVDTYGRVTSITTAANPQGTVTSVGGTGTVNGITLTGTVTSTGNLTLGGTLSNVSLATQVTGNLPVTNLNSGTSASALTFWRGDGTWATPAGAGTVTSVGQTFTGGLISVSGSPITTTGTLALTVAGTSGGIPYFSSASTWASSAALAANALVVGGGAGAAPSTITTGTGVATALGVNTGSAGAFVVNGGALGTPSSGTVTNLTGTASININGTVGATTANTGVFTTATANSFIPNLSTVPTNGMYLPAANTVGFATNSSEKVRVDSTGNVGIGLTNANAYGILATAGNINNLATALGTADAATVSILNNNVGGLGVRASLSMNIASIGKSVISGYYAAFNGSNDIGTGLQFGTQTNAAGGTVERMRIDQNGNVMVGTTTARGKLHSSSSSFNPTAGNVWATTAAFTATGGFGGGIAIIDSGNIGYGMWVQDSGGTLAIGQGSGTGNLTERMRITSAGNVGIGTSSAAARLDVEQTSTTAYALISQTPTVSTVAGSFVNMAYFTNSRSTNNDGLRIVNLRDSTGSGAGDWPTESYRIRRSVDQNDGSSGVQEEIVFGNTMLGFNTGGTERMRIDSSGNVGIGTSSPANKLDVVGDGNYIAQRASTTANASGGVWSMASGFWSTPTYTGTGIQSFGSTAAGTTCGITNVNLGTLVFQNSANALIYTNGGTPIIFGTTSAERMRISAAGDLGIGTTTTTNAKLTVDGGSQSKLFVQRSTGTTVTPPTSYSSTLDGFLVSVVADASPFHRFSDLVAGAGSAGSVMRFFTGTTTSERMRIANSGGVSVGNTTDRGAGALSVANGIYAESTGPFHLNATTVSANFTIPTDFNASSAGPITVNTGITVTISTGSTWIIV